MSAISIILSVEYTIIMIAFIWARFKYFKIDSQAAKNTSYLYDPIAVLHIYSTYYHYLNAREINYLLGLLTGLLYLSGFVLFLVTISGARTRGYAFSNNIEQLITSGTYGFVRHPLYVSYALIWIGSAILFHSILLWITLAYLLVFYIVTATQEEKTISKSKYSGEYDNYRRDVGMFLPRIKGWKS